MRFMLREEVCEKLFFKLGNSINKRGYCCQVFILSQEKQGIEKRSESQKLFSLSCWKNDLGFCRFFWGFFFGTFGYISGSNIGSIVFISDEMVNFIISCDRIQFKLFFEVILLLVFKLFGWFLIYWREREREEVVLRLQIIGLVGLGVSLFIFVFF